MRNYSKCANKEKKECLSLKFFEEDKLLKNKIMYCISPYTLLFYTVLQRFSNFE